MRIFVVRMKALRIIIWALLLGGAALSPVLVEAQSAKLTKEERKLERERKAAVRANAATEVKVRDGKYPSYNRLLKSTSYNVMYTEGLRYYNKKKRHKDHNSLMNYRRAQTLFDLAYRSQKFAGTPQEDSLVYYFGCSFYKTGEFDMSEQIFDRFRRDFTTSKFIEDAEYMYAMGFYFSSPDPEHDQSTTMRAIAAISEYEGRYPNTIKREECDTRMQELRKKLYTKSFENAKLYYTIGQYKAAVRALNNAIDEFPLSPYREELMYLATRSAYLFARNSVADQMTDRYLAMMDNYYDLISEFPETEHLREVEKMRDEAREHIAKHTQETTTQNGSN